MHLSSDLSYFFLNWRFWGMVVLALLALALLGADPVKPNPVEVLRLALEEPRLNPDLIKRLDEAGKPEAQKKILFQERDRKVGECIKGLHTISQMRMALALWEWRHNREEDILAANEKKWALLAQGFMLEARRILKSGDTTSRLAVLKILSDWKEDDQIFSGAIGMVGRNCGPDVVELLKHSEDPSLREATGRALGQIFPEPQVAVPALQEMLASRVATERRVAAKSLGDIVSVASRLTKLGGYPIAQADRSDVIKAAIAVLPVVSLGLGDSDPEVRILSAGAINQSAITLGQLVPEPGSIGEKQDRKDLAEIVKEIETLTLELMPMVQALKEQSTRLSANLTDADPRARLAAIQALESVSDVRLRLREFRKAERLSKRQLDEPLIEGLRSAPQALAQLLSHQEIRIRLAALYVLETLETDAAPAASAVVEALKDENSFVRWGAVRTLGNMAPLEPAKAVPGLAGMVNDANRDVRGTALVALRHYGPAAKAAVPALSRTVNQGDVETRRLAIEAIAAIGPNAGDAVLALITALTDPQTEIRLAAAEALGKLGPSARQAEDALLKTLNDSNPDVRIAAAEALLVPR